MNLKQNLWTEEEVNLIKAGLSAKEIAEKTGRTENAVWAKKKNLKKTGFFVKEVEYLRIPPGEALSQEEKEIRLMLLAKKMGLRIGGKNERIV